MAARERGILRRYKIAPINPSLLISSQLVTHFLISLSTLILQIALAHLFYGITIAGSYANLFLMLSVGVLAFLSLGFVLASVAESVKVAFVAANLFFFPLMFLGGAALPKSMLSPTLQTISGLLPSTYLVEGLSQVIVNGEGLSNIVVPLVVLLLTFAASLLIAARLFRWETFERLSWSQKSLAAAIVFIFVVAAIVT